ncbi:MAG: preprotein translocase subunit SecA [candidate division WOR-3 bacterium]|jgi:preprotein translocase subunit SecA
MLTALKKLIPSKSEREVRRLREKVREINQIYEGYHALADSDLPKKTEEFIRRIQDGESLDSILPEAFALVKEACRRLVGQKWTVTNQEITWDMVPFDVQLIGAIVLHEGKVAEMKTGEGKTLVATMPLYLNALEKKGCHLVTVNDYLARRDREWMGPIYESLGLTVGYIQAGMTPQERRPQYACDITYGTNNEFGFDYLRDNMVLAWEEKVQRGHHYAIIDEVDIILVDEARTPLIISGPVGFSKQQQLQELVPLISRLFREQDRLVDRIVEEGERLWRQGKQFEAGVKFLQALRGSPKNKRLLRVQQQEGVKRAIDQADGIIRRDKRLPEIDAELFFVIDERDHSVELTDKGRTALSPHDPNFFILPDLSTELARWDIDPGLSPEERARRKEETYRQYAEKSDRLANIHALLKAYALFEKDVDYVVTPDGQVVIVDEFTGRLMPGRRFSDGLHEALEAKEQVQVREETQTFGTITLQNYFRMYKKLAGMSGTALSIASELYQVYKLEVIEIPTNAPVRRIDYPDVVFRTKKAKYQAVVNEIVKWHKLGRPILVGTTSVQASEEIDRLLRPTGIRYSILNAKNHEAESQIIAHAGEAGAVTIATNMAGRGTDIKLGPGVVRGEKCYLISGDGRCTYWEEKPGRCYEEVPCGLYVIGTERHEARRIDDQLRGRSGRQGDPGSSRFFLSFEDDLLRLFGSDRMAAIMDRWAPQEDEPVANKLVTRVIANAQKRVEIRNAEIRRHLLEYDDVMNRQREVVYTLRDTILKEPDLTGVFNDILDSYLDLLLSRFTATGRTPRDWNWDGLREEMLKTFLADLGAAESAGEHLDRHRLKEMLEEIARQRYHQLAQELGPERFPEWCRRIFLAALDEAWRDHLHQLDILREGIGLQAYGQKDPLVEYKQESFRLFSETMQDFYQHALRVLFRLDPKSGEDRLRPRHRSPVHAYKPQAGTGTTAGQQPAPAVAPVRRETPKVGRNDPCPCGSGKKYKYCCGRAGVPSAASRKTKTTR